METKNEWEIKIQTSEICTGSDPVNILLPWPMKMAEAKYLCLKYQGKPSVITSAEMRTNLFSQMDKIKELDGCAWPKCVAWTGFSDEEEEGHFVDINEGKALNFRPWALGAPNGKRKENCGISNKLSPDWYDAPCENSYLSFCKIEGMSRFHLRGDM